MKRSITLVLLVGPCLALLATGCPKKNETPDAAVEAPEAAAPVEAAAPAPSAKNAGDISRFGVEKAIANEVAKTVASFTPVRTGPGSGNAVATIGRNTEVTKIAEHPNGAFLVTFADPKAPGTVLMGWITKAAFQPDPILDAGIKDAAVFDSGRTACPANQELITGFVQNAAVCKKRCVDNKDCRGNSSCVPGVAVGGRAVRFCPADPP